ncbi:MAG: phospholipase D-like domain-containing protein [Candidatus Hydrogenedentes bacterium]|nr:phospholipase D-like domain-containing protein [Candidatus Hydrogenedentota bacterium]
MMSSIIYQILIEHAFAIFGFLLATYFIWRVLNEHRRPGGAISWILIIIFAPYIGVPLYFILGKRKWVRKAHSKIPLYSQSSIPQEKKNFINPVEKVLITAGAPQIRSADSIYLSLDGTEAYLQLLKLIASAKHYIYCTTFILGNDEVGKSIIDALTKKAKEGIKVYLLLDSLGCFYLPRKTIKPLTEAGGKVSFFLPILPLRRKWSANLRNHRKIVVIDGHTAIVGGMNLSENFMGPKPNPKRFLDCAVFITGEPVKDIEEIFLRDWEFSTDENISIYPEKKPEITSTTQHLKSLVQVVASGPDVPEDTIYDAILTACMEAKERIWILTPYFVPDEPILKTLILQIRAGVDVSILLPKVSNHITADYARGPAIRELLDNGANIWFYPKGMIHAKLLIFDRFLAITGSPNLDIRSMYLNFEIALFHYSPMEIDCISGWFSQLTNDSEMVKSLPANKLHIFLENLSSLIAPLI